MKNVTFFGAGASGASVLMSAHVESSAIKTIEWNNFVGAIGGDSAGELLVRFWSNESYIYENCPVTVFVALLNATSVGKTYNELVKDKYEYRRLGLKPVAV